METPAQGVYCDWRLFVNLITLAFKASSLFRLFYKYFLSWWKNL